MLGALWVDAATWQAGRHVKQSAAPVQESTVWGVAPHPPAPGVGRNDKLTDRLTD